MIPTGLEVGAYPRHHSRYHRPIICWTKGGCLTRDQPSTINWMELSRSADCWPGKCRAQMVRERRVMSQKKDVPGARGEEDEPEVRSIEAAHADGQSSSTVHTNGRSGKADGEIDSASPTDAVARIVLQAEQLAHGVREVAAREAKLVAAEILSEAEATAREQILEPAATRAAAKSQEIMAEAEQGAEAILAGIERLFSRASSDGSAGDDSPIAPTESAPASGSSVAPAESTPASDSSVAPVESAPASDSVSVKAEGRSNLPPPMSPMQRDQLKEVITRRMGAA